jgi:hypothetical protein
MLTSDEKTAGALATFTGNPAHSFGRGMDDVWKGDFGGALDEFLVEPFKDLSPTVICTELHYQGLLSDDVYVADGEYGRIQDRYLLYGYRFLAVPLVRKMRQYSLLTKAVSLFAIPWAKQMAFEMGVGSKGSLFGKILMIVLYPPVRLIGKVRRILRWQV